MMDRIIFLGTGIDDQIANIVQAQLLFLESADASKDIQIWNLRRKRLRGLEFMIRCNTSSQMLLQFVLEWRLLWERYCCVQEQLENVRLCPIQK
jgi:hypothetical protein